MGKLRRGQLFIMKLVQRMSNRLRTVEMILSDAPNRESALASTRPVNPLQEPIGSLSQFEQINNLLQEPAYRQQMASYLRCFGGRDTEDFARRI
ncbi:unnamed protein product [Dibothriocephalus latus]|uniref:Uncharacterized protein n=1 Tax=Dibothriocephalus latus TaxID=60516 RepID=A0A3P7N6Q4_DIBLA|nr:unnamed protein product [Dibothriocephalus latus]